MLQRIIEEAGLLFREKGYYNTTMDDIARVCHIKKPSLYYHIASREALLLYVVEKQQREFKEEVLQWAYMTNYSSKEKLKRFAEATEKYFADRKSTCLIYKLVFELGNSMPIVVISARALLDGWCQAFYELLKGAHEDSEILYMAEDFFAQIQGALLMGQMNDNNGAIKRVAQRLQALIE